jgi:deoxyguanosine kinase
MLQKELQGQLILEVFEENPFLSNFYADRARYAFQTQIFFLLSRYHQQRRLKMAVRPLISDYIFAKDALFARLNLEGDELEMYEKVHEALAEQIEVPDLVVFLRADTDTLMRRIAQRDRPYERNMEREYIDSLRRAYDYYFSSVYKDAPVLTLDATRLDFVANVEDHEEAIAQLLGALGQAPHQEKLPGFNDGNGKIDSAAAEEEAAQPRVSPAPDLAEGARRLRDFQQFHDWLDTTKNFDRDPFFNFIKLQEEVGELASLLSGNWTAKRDQTAPPPLDEVGSEMADVLAYLLKMANYLGVDLEAAYLEKMRLNQNRNWR